MTVVFVAESLPSFGPLLVLVGSSTLTLTALIFPCLFYLYLTVADEIAEENGKKNPDKIPSFTELDFFFCFKNFFPTYYVNFFTS